METYTAIYSHLSRVVLLLLFSTAIQHVVCEVFTIVPSSESTCPEEQICYTLNQYASNSNLSSGLDNITLELQSGTHTLDIPLVVSYISSFEMSGSGNTMTTLHSVDEFSFYEVNFVHLSGIKFINGGSHSSSTSTTQFSVFLVGMFILENSTFQTSKKLQIIYTNRVLIANSCFSRSPSGVLSIVMSTVTIKNSTFSDNDMISDSDIDLGVISTVGSSMMIENSIFMNNHLNPNSTSSRLTSYVGAVIDAVGDAHMLMIINSTFFNNSGPSTGALRSYDQFLVISGCTFSNNVGFIGAVHSFLQSLEISGSIFSNNVGYGEAGALSVVGERVLISQSTFHNNNNIYRFSGTSAIRAYLYPQNGSVTIEDSTFINNNSSGAMADLRMGLDRYSTVLIERSSFINNTVGAGGRDGALYVTGYPYQSFTLRQSTFVNNSADSDRGESAVSVQGGLEFITIEQNLFANNTGQIIQHSFSPSISGRARFSSGSNLFIIDNLFVNNSATSCGSAIDGSQTQGLFGDRMNLLTYNVKLESNVFSFNGQNTGLISGSVLCFHNANVSVLNSNFSHSSGGFNGGVMNVRYSMVEIEQSIFRFSYAEYSGGVIYATDSHVKINHSTIEHNQAGLRGGAIGIYTGKLEIEDTSIRNSSGILYGGTIIACESEVAFSYPFSVSTFTSIYDQKCLQYYNKASSKFNFSIIISTIMPLLILLC